MAAVALHSAEDLQARIDALVAENERLRDELDFFRGEELGTGFLAPVEWGLTAKEMVVMGILMARELCPKGAIYLALYGGQVDDGPEPKIVDVYVCKMRAKVEPLGILIETRWGQGYFMSEASKELARELMAASPSMGQAA